jgi:hypothetical protein
MVTAAFSATLTTATTLITATMVRCLNGARSHSTTSTEMKRAMGEDTKALPVMMRAMNTPCPDIAVAAMARGIARTQSN